MTANRDLLIELGTEELPPKALRKLSNAFADGVTKGLEQAGLCGTSAQVFAAPRRLAMLIRELPVSQGDREIVRRGPALSAAFDEDGCPTKAALGFASSCGVEVEKLDQLETKKGSWLSYRAVEKGQKTASLIPVLVEKSLAGLPIPKRMRWGDHEAEFVRPVHWLVLLFGDDVIEARIMGINSTRSSYGHRFHHPGAIELDSADRYLVLLEKKGKVIADFSARQQAILEQVNAEASKLGGEALVDEDLLEEVTALVEWPVAISGKFDNAFLDIPPEALISSMQDHQKYFPLTDQQGKLLPHFITVANIESKDPGKIVSGNERVIRPRLADAAFFWNQDRKKKLIDFADGLQRMVFQKKLGSLFDKQDRVANLAALISRQIGGNEQDSRRAASLCKCDLLTSMVYEFPELQGIMGHYYAQHDGEPDEVAIAIEEHYQPRFSGDVLPQTNTGQALALADRIDSLVGIFAIGQPPSGDKDPFALRRAALGVVRICIEQRLDLDLAQLLAAAASNFDATLDAGSVTQAVLEYVMDRLHGYFQETGIAADLIDAVLATRPVRLLDCEQRIRACQVFRALPEAASLAAANKRIRNILKKTEEEIPPQVNASMLQDKEEQQLAERLHSLQEEVIPLMEAGDYTPALEKLAALREPVDAFFDQVMVMVEEDSLRRNRLALLNNLSDLFLRVADLSRLQN